MPLGMARDTLEPDTLHLVQMSEQVFDAWPQQFGLAEPLNSFVNPVFGKLCRLLHDHFFVVQAHGVRASIPANPVTFW